MARFCVLLALLCACGDDAAPALDAGAADSAVDGGVDGGVDTGPVLVDAGPDTTIPMVDAGPACDDGVLNGDETDTDCGGSCTACDIGGICVASADCLSTVCTNNSCVAAACDDGVLNGDETDMDCGGSCAACDVGDMCVAAADCLSGVCTGDSCVAPACDDGVQNGDETDLDCGGACDPCERGESCLVDSDCLDTVCYSSEETATCERVTYITGTTVAVDPVLRFAGQSIIRLDFTAPPTVISSDGTPVTLPVSGAGTFVSSTFTPAFASSTVTVAGTTLVNPTGNSRYQSISNNDFYGVVLGLSDEANAITNFDTLAAAGLESDEIEIVIVDTSP